MAGRAAGAVGGDNEENLRGAPGGEQNGSVVDVQKDGDEPDFEIVETDSDLNPLPTNGDQREAPLSEDAEGQRPVIQTEQQDGDGESRGRPRRGETMKERRQRQKQTRDNQREENRRMAAENARLQDEINNLRGRMDGIEPRVTEIDQSRIQSELAQIEREINEEAARAARAKQDMASAIAEGDASRIAEAMDVRDQAIMKGQQLLVRKNMVQTGDPLGRRVDERQGAQPRQVQPTQQQPAGVPMSPAAKALATQFMQENPWYDARGGNQDSRVLNAIDSQIYAEGFRPDTQAYWEELYDRMEQYLPHRAGAPENEEARRPAQQQNGAARQNGHQAAQPQRRGPAVGGGGDRGNAPAPGKNQVYLSPERKQALRDAGLLGDDGKTVLDREKFKSVLKKYQEFDRDNGLVRQ